MKINDILFNLSIVFSIFLFIVIIVVIRYAVVLWIEVRKAQHHFHHLEPKINEITECIIVIEKNVSEIENTPLIHPQLTTTMRRYKKIARTVMKNQSKYRMKKMKKQEKKLKKSSKNQTKKYQKR